MNGPPSPRPAPSYSASGVDLAAGRRAVELMRRAVESTHGPEVLAGLGSFGGVFDASALTGLTAPLLVASTDGVGTKVRLAAQTGRYDSIGHDLVNHCVNDILVQGARPLFFLDYFATSRLDPVAAAAVVAGMAAACREAGCALLGGETAEMPDVYQAGEFDLAGTIVGVVDRDGLLPRPSVRAGDVLLGLRSTGPHTNGYTLIRQVFSGVPLDAVFPGLGVTLSEALLAPHRSYLRLVLPLLQARESGIKALAHLTGGCFFENIPRVLPAGVGAIVRPDRWPLPPLFGLIQRRGGIDREEMFRVFNMGIGLVVIAAAEDVEALRARIDEETYLIGELVSGEREVTLA